LHRHKDEQRFHESFKEEGFMQKAWRVPQRAKGKTIHNQKVCSHATLLAWLDTIILNISKYHWSTFFFAHIMDQLTPEPSKPWSRIKVQACRKITYIYVLLASSLLLIPYVNSRESNVRENFLHIMAKKCKFSTCKEANWQWTKIFSFYSTLGVVLLFVSFESRTL